jgi:hypothetical protein
MATTQDQSAKIREILQQLDQLPVKNNDNRRKAPRVPVHIAMIVTLLSGIAPSPVEIYSRNISLSGLGFVSRRMFRREERIAMLLRFPNTPPKLILARVTFGRYISSGLYEMGSEFLECINDPKNPDLIPNEWVASAHTP